MMWLTSAVVAKYSVAHSLGVPLGVLINTNIWKSIKRWTFKLQPPRICEDLQRVFSLGKATLCWKQLSEDLETLVPAVVRPLLVLSSVKLCSSLRKRRDICSCLDKAPPGRQWCKSCNGPCSYNIWGSKACLPTCVLSSPNYVPQQQGT